MRPAIRKLAAAIQQRPTLALYAAAVVVSITGASTSAEKWLRWPLLAAVAAVAVVELGGVVLSIHADRRREKGESAIPARLLAYGVALGAVAVNWFGHYGPTGWQLGQAAFFGGVSALGFATYLIDSSARRRDALRKAGKLADTPPVYGPAQWLRHPLITRRARRLAQLNAEQRAAELATNPHATPTTPRLGMLASLDAAVAELRAERRRGAVSAELARKIRRESGRTMATIAVNTYDMDRVAASLAESADYDGLAALIGAELTPARIGGQVTGTPSRPALTFDEVDLADDDAPVSGGAPVNLAGVSKTAAIHYAHTALGDVPAPRVVDYLATAGVKVSESLVYKARRQVPAPVAELSANTPPALPAAPEPTPAPLALVESTTAPTPARPRRPRTTRPARTTATPPEVTPDTTEQTLAPAASSAPRRPARRTRTAIPAELSDSTTILTPVNGTRPDLATPATN